MTLVLGGGGTHGIAYLAGALRALRDATGFEPSDAEVIVGTSAGALVAAQLRMGCPLEELADRALGGGLLGRPGPAVRPLFHNPQQFLARQIGSSWVIARSAYRFPLPSPPRHLGRLFPGGFMEARHPDNVDSLPHAWPSQATWIVTVDLRTGRRIVLGTRPSHFDLPFSRAVKASTAVPAVFAPIRLGSHLLVDGGVHSVTNLDLAVRAAPRLAICIAPMAYDPRDPPNLTRRVVAAQVNRRLVREQLSIQRSGIETLVLRPGHEELRHIRLNFLATAGLGDLHAAAYRRTTDKLAALAFREKLFADDTEQ